jgi:hypothetical protein
MRATRTIALFFLTATTVGLLLIALRPWPSVRDGTTGGLLLDFLTFIFLLSAVRWYWLDTRLVQRTARKGLP